MLRTVLRTTFVTIIFFFWFFSFIGFLYANKASNDLLRCMLLSAFFLTTHSHPDLLRMRVQKYCFFIRFY